MKVAIIGKGNNAEDTEVFLDGKNVSKYITDVKLHLNAEGKQECVLKVVPEKLIVDADIKEVIRDVKTKESNLNSY